MEKLLTVRDVTKFVRLSYPTLHRMMNAGTFPVPVNGRKRKLLWTQDAIEQWVNRQSVPNNAVLPPVNPRQQKREVKALEQRRESARQTLLRHAVGRNVKSKNEKQNNKFFRKS